MTDPRIRLIEELRDEMESKRGATVWAGTIAVRLDAILSTPTSESPPDLRTLTPEELAARYDALPPDPTSESVSPRRCPTCDSPNKTMHPAVQHEGEVELCRDPWHEPTAEQIEKAESVSREDAFQTEWADYLALKFAHRRTGGSVYMSGKHNPLPSEKREAAEFVNDVLAAHRSLIAKAGDTPYLDTYNQGYASGYAAALGRNTPKAGGPNE